MKNLGQLGLVGGLIGGGICAFAGLICLLQGLSVSATGGGAIQPGLFFAIGFYFIGKGVFAASISLNIGGRSTTSAEPTR
jgi:hypothetical protein